MKELSAKLDAIIEFRGGYVKTNEGVKQERGFAPHLNRNAGAYIGSISFLGPGTAIGALIDRSRRKKNKLITRTENPVPGSMAKGKALSSKLDELLFNDPRPRNNLGEFSPQQEGVADPNSMAKTYATPKKAAGYAGAAIAGGALGAVGGAGGKDAYTAIKNLLNRVRKPKL